MNRIVFALAVLSSAATASAGPVLLWSLSVGGSHRYTGPTQDRVQFTLDLQSTTEPRVGPFALVSPLVSADDQSTIIFSSETPEAFAGFAALLTNGIEDDLRFLWDWPESSCPSPCIGRGGSIGELDLTGNTLESVRLLIHEVRFEPESVESSTENQRFTFGVTYLFFGTPVPEPTSLVLIGIGFCVVLTAHHSRAVVANNSRNQ